MSHSGKHDPYHVYMSIADLLFSQDAMGADSVLVLSPL